MAITQEDYLNDNSSVKAARKKLDAAKAALSNAKKAESSLPASAGSQIASQIKTRVSQAQKELDAQIAALSTVETKAKNYFIKNEAAIQEKAASKEKATSELNIAAAQAQIERMKQSGLDTTQLESQVTAAKSKKSASVVLSSNAAGDGTTGGNKQKPDDFAGLLKSASKYIAEMSGPNRKFLAQSLNDSLGLTLPVSELIDPLQLLGAYQSAITGAQARFNTFKDTPTVEGYLNQKKLELSSIVKAGGSSGLGKLPEPTANILNDTEAASVISNSFNSLLGREATPKEIAKLSKDLIAALRNPKNAQRATRNKNGVVEYSGGIKPDQWISDKIKALPEYGSKVQAKQDLVAQGIETTARANGLKLRPEEIKVYADRIKNGEDLKTIENQIRSIASLGQPDAIKKLMQDGTDLETLYSPYKRIMAASLGINSNTITLDDPTLRMAIGPEKEMSLYDYQKAIRTDNRWKYSQEANDEVTNMVNQVKRDFGFMG
jgi:hypothetical protein